jgi:hypothetical protein
MGESLLRLFIGVFEGKHCVDRLRSIGVFDREFTKIFPELELFIMMAFSKLLIFDWTEDASGDVLIGLLPVSDSLGAG